MAKKNTRKPVVTQAPSRPEVLGIKTDGKRGLIQTPMWRQSYGYWGAFELSAQLSATGFQIQEQEEKTREGMFDWHRDVEPGSVQEQRQLIGAQMHVAQSTIARLAAAQVVVCDLHRLHEVQEFTSHADAQDWALTASIPWPALYIDLCAPGVRSVATLAAGDGTAWQFAGALLWRDSPDEPLSIALYASPSDDEGPIFQPLTHTMMGEGKSLMSPQPGEIVIDCVSGQSVTPMVANPDSRLNARVKGALELSIGALSFARYILSDDTELISEQRNPKARKMIEATGELIALTPKIKTV